MCKIYTLCVRYISRLLVEVAVDLVGAAGGGEEDVRLGEAPVLRHRVEALLLPRETSPFQIRVSVYVYLVIVISLFCFHRSVLSLS